MTERFNFATVPSSLEELRSLPEYSLDTPYKTAALTMIVLCNYKNNVDSTIEMLNDLKGPEDLSQLEIQFLKDRLQGKEYKPYSFFLGATPENEYTPTSFTIEVEDNPYSFQDEDYATMHIKSSGADSLRQIKLRKKPSTGQWFLVEIQCLSDIRIPTSADPWA